MRCLPGTPIVGRLLTLGVCVAVSGGFAIMNPDSSLNITAVEAVPVDHLDIEAARRSLADAAKEVERAANDVDRAQAQIKVEVLSAVVAAGSA